MAPPLLHGRWSPQKSAELYLINHWGQPFFGVNEDGNVAYAPSGPAGASIDIKCLIDDLAARGIRAPILQRFNDILGQRIAHLDGAFRSAMARVEYQASYPGVMPIKVNQQRHVVEELVRRGEAFGLGLVAGSKPELLVAMALLAGRDAAIVCNGYKDREYIETALHAQRLGLTPYIVLDRFDELDLVLRTAENMGIRPHIGLRAKLQARGSGRWAESSGDRSKFGLSAREMVEAVRVLTSRDHLDCLCLLHFHIGSQITNIRSVKDAVREAAHLYVGLREMGATNLCAIDCGGGLAIDYDGSKTDFHASKNYSSAEYAEDIVNGLRDICQARNHPHPNIMTGSGRALIAQHSVLIFNVLGVHRLAPEGHPPVEPPSDAHDLVKRLWTAVSSIGQRNFQAALNDIVELKEESALLFSHGVIDLQTRAQAEAEALLVCFAEGLRGYTYLEDFD